MLGEFKSAYPQAKLCVTPGAAEKLKPKNVVIDARMHLVLSASLKLTRGFLVFGPRDAKFGFEDEVNGSLGLDRVSN